LEIQILQSNDNKKIIKKKKIKIQNYIVARVNFLFITFIVKHKKLMEFMVPNKLFRVAEFLHGNLGILFVNLLNKCTTTCQKKKSTETIG